MSSPTGGNGCTGAEISRDANLDEGDFIVSELQLALNDPDLSECNDGNVAKESTFFRIRCP